MFLVKIVKKTLLICLSILVSFSFFNSFVFAEESIQLKKRVSGLGVPWGMAFLSDNEALVSEREGVLKRVRFSSDDAQINIVQGLPEILPTGQGGLLDVRVAPDQQPNIEKPVIYFTYVGNSSVPGKHNIPTLKLSRAELDGLQLINQQVLFEANKPQKGGRHFGSRIAFDNKGHIYFSMGDRGQRNSSQDLGQHSGSIFRLKLDGSIPEDNPFVDKSGAMPEIWSFGHRNPQGLMFDVSKDKLWSIEHGPRGGDEINHIEKGKNYGWPVISYGREYISNFKVSASPFKEGMEQPVHYFSPSIAPGSLLVYSGKKKTEWEGALLSGALKLRHLNVVTVDHNKQFVAEKRLFERHSMRVRNVVENPAGEIFIATDNGDIFQLIL